MNYRIELVLEVFVRKVLALYKVLGSHLSGELFDLNDTVEEFVLAELFVQPGWKSEVRVEEGWYEREIRVGRGKGTVCIAEVGMKGYVRIG